MRHGRRKDTAAFQPVTASTRLPPRARLWPEAGRPKPRYAEHSSRWSGRPLPPPGRCAAPRQCRMLHHLPDLVGRAPARLEIDAHLDLGDDPEQQKEHARQTDRRRATAAASGSAAPSLCTPAAAVRKLPYGRKARSSRPHYTVNVKKEPLVTSESCFSPGASVPAKSIQRTKSKFSHQLRQ